MSFDLLAPHVWVIVIDLCAIIFLLRGSIKPKAAQKILVSARAHINLAGIMEGIRMPL